MMKSTIILTALLTALFSCNAISAGINERQANQQARILQGLASGELTARETVWLSKEQKRINKLETRFKADGRFTRRERALLQSRLNTASRNIFRQTHDRQGRY